MGFHSQFDRHGKRVAQGHAALACLHTCLHVHAQGQQQLHVTPADHNKRGRHSPFHEPLSANKFCIVPSLIVSVRRLRRLHGQLTQPGSPLSWSCWAPRLSTSRRADVEPGGTCRWCMVRMCPARHDHMPWCHHVRCIICLGARGLCTRAAHSAKCKGAVAHA